MIRMTLKDGTRYDLDDNGNVLARSDGPQGWDYSGKWRILGFTTRHHSRHIITLADALAGADVGQGWIHDLDHGSHRMWGSPTGRRLASLAKV